jgi:hypothetical protein
VKRKLSVVCLVAVLIMAIAGLGIAADTPKKEGMKAPSVTGTYKLISRKLPDGKMITPPDIQGLQTYTKNYRNFNVAWTDSTGKHFSYSVVSTYKLTGAEYSETILFSLMNDEIGGKPAAYTMKGETKTVPVKMEGSKMEFKLPFDPVTATFDGSKMMGIADGMFTDTWEKVQ